MAQVKINQDIFPEATEFWAGAKRSELMIQRCEDCRKYVFYPRAYCPHDMGNLYYEKVSGKGRILSFSIVEKTGDPLYAGIGPFAAAVIQLDEGPLMYSRILTNNLDAITFQQEVEVVFEQHGGATVPLFRPVNHAD